MSFGIYETVTNRIIAELEAGAIPWTQPWKNQKSGGVMPLNRATGRPYSGINIPILWGAASAFGYPSHQWLTFKQALDMKACVKKGEKGTQVVFTKRIPRDDDEEHGTISMLKTFYVFNVQQIDGLERIPTPELVDIDEGDVNQLADRFIAATKADIRIGGSKACFVPSQDFIAMPPREAFEQQSSFYAAGEANRRAQCGHRAPRRGARSRSSPVGSRNSPALRAFLPQRPLATPTAANPTSFNQIGAPNGHPNFRRETWLPAPTTPGCPTGPRPDQRLWIRPR